jgi:Domain of unknown function (DUF4954)
MTELNIIRKTSIDKLGYNFIKPEYLPKGKDEYYLRNMQNRSGIAYRQLTAYEIEVLVRNGNTSDDWNKILVSNAFNPELVKSCKFFGLVRIGKLEPYCLEFSDLKLPVGLYNSTIISCDFGDNVVIDNVNYLSNYIIGNEAIIVNVNELATSDHAKFGNGIIKEGEPESVRIWLEICNENGGRSVIPFNGMLPADAWLWSKYRDDEQLLHQFKTFTEDQFKKERGFYGKVGDRTVIKNCAIIKDVWIGSDAYIKGANKLKNLTINSGPEGISQIGEGCELVNGIIGFGCRIFYGVKAVRFIMASNSQLKYGARLINSYLGNNSTISCCEVLNSLIFPAHEQHHNNSFLCAALVLGQSNIPAGATIGSNHNSRAPDGEIVAGRGFWPGLCVSLKHNSKLASFTILAKADYSYELNIPIPFSLVSIDAPKDQLIVMPAYWFMYNMYALARNSWKYADRDKQIQPIQQMEYDYLAPDTVNEMFHALSLIEYFTGKAFYKKEKSKTVEEDLCRAKGKDLLQNNDPIVDSLEIEAEAFENTKRKAIIIKVRKAYTLFIQMINYYGSSHLAEFIENNNIKKIEDLQNALPSKLLRNEWLNAGGQLMTKADVNTLRKKIREEKIKSWDQLHHAYNELAGNYLQQKSVHAIASLFEINSLNAKILTKEDLNNIFTSLLETKKWITGKIYESRAKDYSNPYRKMIYDTEQEMNSVVGCLSTNSFIQKQQKELATFKTRISLLKKRLKL